MKKIYFTSLVLGAALFFASCSSSNIKEPEYRDIRDISVKQVGLLESTAGIDLVYYNPNNFGVQLTDAYGDLYIDNKYIGKFELDRDIRVQRRSEFIVPGVLKIDMLNAVKHAGEIVNSKEALIKLNGTARLKKAGMSMSVPIDYEGMQNIEKFRQFLYRSVKL